MIQTKQRMRSRNEANHERYERSNADWKPMVDSKRWKNKGADKWCKRSNVQPNEMKDETNHEKYEQSNVELREVKERKKT